MPDLEYSIRQYLNNPSTTAAHEFMKDTFLGHETRRRNLRAFLVSWLGNSKHLWMYDFKSITFELHEAGFVEIRRASFGDSPDLKFLTVEDKSKWTNALGIECKRPVP